MGKEITTPLILTNKSIKMKWIEASERLPEATNGRAKQIVVKFVFKDDVQMRVLTANGFIDLIKMCTDKDKIEWLDEESNVSSQEPDGEQKAVSLLRQIYDGYTRFNRYEQIPDSTCKTCHGFLYVERGGVGDVDCPSCNGTGSEFDTGFDTEGFTEFIEHSIMFADTPFLELIGEIEPRQNSEQSQQEPDATASKEIDEPLIQNNSINDDDFEEDPDPTCEACGYNHGNHMKGCPNDDSPFALLCRRGFD